MRKIRTGILAIVLMAPAIAISPSVHAKTATTTFQVEALVPSACTIDATDVNFGTVPSDVQTPIDATGTLTVDCTTNVGYAVSLNAGMAPGATVTTRQMQNGTALLSYALYSNSARTTIWGDGTGGSVEVSGTGNGNQQLLTVYGRIPANQTDLAAGSFSDTITATVTY